MSKPAKMWRNDESSLQKCDTQAEQSAKIAHTTQAELDRFDLYPTE